MGTSIRLNAYKGDETDGEEWEGFSSWVKENFADSYRDEEYIDFGFIHCSYSGAEIDVQIPAEIREQYANTGIRIELFYEERDADEVQEL